MDHQGFEDPVVALRFLAPVDWVVEGGVQWKPPIPVSEPLQVGVRASSPDGSVAFEMFLTYVAEWV